jgi:nitroreductase
MMSAMKRSIMFCCVLGLMVLTAWANEKMAETRELPAPTRSGGMPIMDALNARKTTRAFQAVPISDQQLSDVLWAACGFNRENQHRTIPTAMNMQDVRVAVLDARGAWRYDPAQNVLEQVVEGDHRDIVASQPFVKDAAVTLIYISDQGVYGRAGERGEAYAYFHAGEMAQNVSLYCSSAGLANVVRGYVPEEALRELLKLAPKERIIMTHTLGISAE